MNLKQEKVEEMLLLIRQSYPNWTSFADPDFMADEVNYKHATIAKARELLNKTELKHLITEHNFEEFVARLDKIGKDNNLLWRRMPSTGDLNILEHPNLDKPGFCEAVFDLLYGSGDSPERLERYVNYVESRQLPNKWTFPTYFLFICHPDTEMFVKPDTTKWLLKFFEISDTYTTKPTPLTYTVIQELTQRLKNELQEYGPRDMVDIQSFIWVCRPDKQDENEKRYEIELAKPFSLIFTNRDEADWAFDFLLKTCQLLGINNPEDERFALTLRHGKNILEKHTLRLNFGNWAVLSIYAPELHPHRVSIPFIVDQINLDKNMEGFNFSQQAGEPDIREYILPIEIVQSFNENLSRGYEVTFDYIAYRFKNWKRCNWRKHHIPQIAEAIFDSQKRKKLFTEGLSEEMLSKIEPDTTEEAILELPPVPQLPPYPLSILSSDTGLDESALARWIRAIERKGQAILYGPPGTGKTFVAEKLARHLIADDDGFMDLVQFHPAYAYEDFVQGLRPQGRPGGGLDYPLVPGRFLDFCRQAQTRQGRCVLIIDEINRANLARVFGELMYLLEYRDREIPLAAGGLLRIPANVRLIGTMNTADRSIALVDHALRRRFAFIALWPNYEVLRRYHQHTGFPVEKLIDTLIHLNREIADVHYAVGITFFLREDLATQVEDIWRMEIEPYLEEYFFDQPDKVAAFRWEVIQSKILPTGR